MHKNIFVLNAVDNAIGFPVNFEILPDVNPFEFRGNVATVGKFFEGKACGLKFLQQMIRFLRRIFMCNITAVQL